MLRHNRRWLIVALLFSLSVVNFLDRQTLSVLSHGLRRDLGFGEIEYSYIVAAFLVAYTIGFAFGGRIIDRVGVRISLAFALALWSGAAMMHAFAAGWIALALCRFFLGLGESFSAPAAARAVSEWTPERERGLSMAIISNGFMIGAMLAPPLVTVITLLFGWWWAFLVTGALGFVMLAVWLRFYNTPEKADFLSDQERARILAERGGGGGDPVHVSIWKILTHPLCIALILARMLTDPLSHFLTFWLPEYLQSSRSFSLALIGLLGWIPFLAADVGGPGGGAVSDWLVRRGMTPVRARMTLMSIAAFIMPLSLVAVRVEDAGVSLALIAVMLAAHSCWNVNLLTLIINSFPRHQVATVVGLAGMGGSIGGIFSTLATGKVITAFGYVPVFTAFGFVHLTALAVLIFAIRRHTRLLAANPPAFGEEKPI